MATSNKYFSPTPGAVNLKDYQHAARLFVDDNHRLAPKAKFLYHVSFSINTNAISMVNMDFKNRHSNEINMLVKTVELPKFTIQVDTLNQYNRKKNTQVKVDYNPVVIRFHDDNAGVTRQLWESYFKYYYADPTSALRPGAYARNATKGSSSINSLYGLDNGVKRDMFFNNITIYQMGKKYWNSYTLVNPVITQWNHDSLDYSSSQPGEQSMTLTYESVAYNTGQVSQGNPPGFGLEHYDTKLSPIGLGGNIGRVAGVVAGAASVFGSVTSGKFAENPVNALATAIAAVNTYQNIKSLAKSGVSGLEAVAGVAAGITAAANQATTGIQNISFPIANVVNQVSATARNLNTAANAIRGII